MRKKRYHPQTARKLLKKKRQETRQGKIDWSALGTLPFLLFMFASCAPAVMQDRLSWVWILILAGYATGGLYLWYGYRLSRVTAARPEYLSVVRRAVRPSRYVLLLQTKTKNNPEGWRFAEIYREARRLGGSRRALNLLLRLCDEATVLYIDAVVDGIEESEAVGQLLSAHQQRAEELATLIVASERTRLARGDEPSEKIVKGKIHDENRELLRLQLLEVRGVNALDEATLMLERDQAMSRLGGDVELQEVMETLRLNSQLNQPEEM